ncbi:ATP-binding protein [Cellulomonas sp. ICMP 17802]|uniref:ATP-binding protein n=1 Tax=Cellulomonas sp. ICMP 17802 TaxID=3239199 RepID=UPI00351B1594
MPDADLLGRDSETAALGALLDGLPLVGGALVLRGAAGIGKSALLAYAAHEAGRRGQLTLGCTGVPTETRLPYAALHLLLRPVLLDARALPETTRQVLDAAFGPSAEPAPDPFRLVLAVLDLLTSTAGDTGTVLLVDDLHWLDAASAEVVLALARRAVDESVVVLAAITEGTGGPVEPGLPASVGVPELLLGPLPADAARALLDRHGASLDDTDRARVLEVADGHPLALAELPAAVRGRTRRPSSDLEPVPMTDRLERAFAGRLADLPPRTRDLLLVAALHDLPDVHGHVRAARLLAGRPVGADDLRPAVAAGLVRVEDRLVQFRHPLVRAAVVRAATDDHRDAAHRAVGQALAATDPRRALWHRAAAASGPDDALADELRDAGLAAIRRGFADVALSAFERAARLSAEPVRRAHNRLDAAEAAYLLGRPDEITRQLDEAAPDAVDPLSAARLSWLEESLHHTAWSGGERLPAFVEFADRLAAAGRSEQALDVLESVALRAYWSLPVDGVREGVAAAVGRLDVAADDTRRLAVLAYVDPDGSGHEVLAAIERYAPGAGAGPRDVAVLASVATAVGAYDRAVELFAAAEPLARASGRLGLLTELLTGYAWALVHAGRGRRAAAVAADAVRLATETGQSRWRAVAQLAAASAQGVLGHEDEAMLAIAAAEAELVPLGASTLLALAQVARGLTVLGSRRPGEAFDHLRRIYDPTDVGHHPQVRTLEVLDLAEAAVHAGRRAEASRLIADLPALLDRTGSPALRVGLTCAAPLLADREDAGPLFDAALAQDLSAWPFHHARLMLAHGSWLRRQRQVVQARSRLRIAAEQLDAIGAVAWADRAREELRASGETVRRRVPDALDVLTPQELQVAQLAAAGLSNREIGDRLYLSSRTVSTHLYRLFPKLGVTSRHDLARVGGLALPDALPDPDDPYVT